MRVGAETVEVLDGAKVVARHPRSQKGEENLVLDHYLEVLASNRGRCPGPRRWPGPGPQEHLPKPTNAFGPRPAGARATATAPGR